MNNDINKLLDSLAKTKFRGSFHLNNKMKDYVKKKGLDKIKKDTFEIIIKRLAPAAVSQVHPTFIAQHATGTCCRGCLKKIHHIPKGKELTNNEINYIVLVIITWIKKEIV